MKAALWKVPSIKVDSEEDCVKLDVEENKIVK